MPTKIGGTENVLDDDYTMMSIKPMNVFGGERPSELAIAAVILTEMRIKQENI